MSRYLQLLSIALAFSAIACSPERDYDRDYSDGISIKTLLIAILAVAIIVPAVYAAVKLFNKCYNDTKQKLYEEVKAMLQADVAAQQNNVYSLCGRVDDQLAYPKRSQYNMPRYTQDMNKSSLDRVQYLFV